MNWCTKIIFLIFFLSTAGLVTVSVLYGTADESQYLTNCTVAEKSQGVCILVRPVDGVITFPYQFNQTEEYVGGKEPCDLIGTLVPCYIYSGARGGDIDNGVPGIPFTEVTTNVNDARKSDHSTLLIFIIVLSLLTACSLFMGFLIWYMEGRMGKQPYDEL